MKFCATSLPLQKILKRIFLNNTMTNNISGQFMFVDRAELNAIFEEAAARIVATQVKKLGASSGEEQAAEYAPFLTRAETAEMLKVDFTTLWRWNKSGFLRAIKVGARKVMYKYEDVLAVLENK